MKLRNLFLAGLTACTMASCSKDEAVDIYANGPIDASLSMGTVLSMEMKGANYENDDNGTGNEANVKTLDVYIFKSGTLQLYKNYKKEDDKETLLTSDFAINHLTIKIGKTPEPIVMYLVANCKPINKTNLDEFKNATVANDITTYVLGDYMPMASNEIMFSSEDLTPLAQNQDAENWITQGGAIVSGSHQSASKPDRYESPIKLTRLISRVQVKSLKVQFAEGVTGSFTLQRLSFVNVVNNVKLNGGGVLPWVKMYQSDAFKVKDKAILSKSDVINGSFVTGTVHNMLTKEFLHYNSGTVSDFGGDEFCAYIFPNNAELKATAVEGVTDAQNYQTILLISGLYKVSANDKGSLKHFRVPIETPAKGNIVEPNHIYKINVTITGQGSTNEDEYELNAHVSAKITVEPWKVVIQNEEDVD